MNRNLKKVFGGAAVVFAMTLGGAFFHFLLRVLLARKLPVEGFGLFYAILGFLTPIGVLKNLGVNMAMTRYLPVFQAEGRRERMKEALNICLMLSLSTSLLVVVPVFFLSDRLAVGYFKAPEAESALKVMLLYMAVGALGGVLGAFFNGLKRPVLLSTRALGVSLAVLIMIVSAGSIDVRKVCIIHVAAEGLLLLVSVLLLFSVFPYFKVRTSFSLSGFKRLLSFGLKAITSHLVNRIFGHLDILILTLFKNLAQVGFYSAAQPFSRLFIILGSSIGKMMLPVSSEIFSSGDRRELQNLLRNVQRVVLFAMMPIGVVLFLFSAELLQLIFGRSYEAGSLVVRLLVVGCLLHSLTVINTYVIIGIGHPLTVTKMTTIQSLVNLGGNVAFIPFWGINGAALATLLAYWFMFLSSCRYVRNLVGYAFDWEILGKITLSSLAMFTLLKGARFCLPEVPAIPFFLVALPVSFCVYLLVSFVTGLVSRRDFKRILGEFTNRWRGRDL
ncbi:MAG: flippase [Deltaproteobacteria bacterium]|nr:flippase [Deltaproteobacteria bacterium]MBW2130678.1 flippase [Deltaproteobacteria bacterium]